MRAFDTLSYRGQLGRLRQLGHVALQHYDVPAPQLTPVRHETNTTFRVRAADDQQYVLRIHRADGHTPDQIRSEVQWLLALRRDTDLDVPQPVLTRDGEPLVIADAPGMPGPRTCVLFRWMDGRFFEEHFSPAQIYRIGVLTAHLHEHTAHWQPPADFARGRVDTLTDAARQLVWQPPTDRSSDPVPYPADDDVDQTLRLVASLCSPEDAALVQQVVERVRAVFRELGERPDVFGLIHADLHQENYFFGRGEPRAIDFDDCGWGHYLFDLNVTLRELADLPNYADLRDALLQGYRSIRSLPVAHERFLDTFFALRRLQLLMWVLQSREHPAFRDDWRESAAYDLQRLKEFVTNA